MLQLGSAGSDITPSKTDSALKSFSQIRISDKSDTSSGVHKTSLTSSSGIQEAPSGEKHLLFFFDFSIKTKRNLLKYFHLNVVSAPKGRGRISTLMQPVSNINSFFFLFEAAMLFPFFD